MVLSLDRFEGKVAVVTGASSGIGAAVSELLVEHGVIVVGLARRVDVIEAKAEQLQDKKGQLYALKTDMRSENDIVNAFQWIQENLGPVHILVNSAGVTVANNLYDGDAEIWKMTLDVNVLGLCIATREAVKMMLDNNINGHIIHLNSVAGHNIVNMPGINVYGASKHGVTSLAGTLKNELNALGAKIKVTSVSPGMVASEMTVMNPTMDPERLEMMKSLPILKAEDVAEAICYCLSTPENVQINQLTITPMGEQL
ncbi:farnesol dehydrogenase [Tribolium castaneum]|uniref:Dehydrogenase/reductase SDR family protein 7-like n=1 Tax=Tribolium castaneum TaxID=7070 RepID=D2A5V5_TRICA|nr:PREDICTED: farnesol dehydrogenase [Tribolium castaneum]EFA05423.1 Dehydrogenase/reductase SDR family protein 7-like [Tribolium castaneum]|eukprot:XP_968453.1 PREDICTED: farnesol dehydrogenase [Tribolium castaneum]